MQFFTSQEQFMLDMGLWVVVFGINYTPQHYGSLTGSKYSTLGYNYNNENNQQSAQFDPFMISVAQAPHYE